MIFIIQVPWLES